MFTRPSNYYWFLTLSGTQVVIEKTDLWGFYNSKRVIIRVMRELSEEEVLKSISRIYADTWPSERKLFNARKIEESVVKGNNFLVFDSGSPERYASNGGVRKEMVEWKLLKVIESYQNQTSTLEGQSPESLAIFFSLVIIEFVIPYLVKERREEEALALSDAFFEEIVRENKAQQKKLEAKIVKEIEEFFSILLRTHQERVDALVNIMET